MTTLGQTLASNIVRELSEYISPAEIAEQKRQAHIRNLASMGAVFFAKAQQYFTNGITAGIPTSSLQLQIGGKGFKEADDYHENIRNELDWHDIDGKRFHNTENEIPTSMTDPDRFAASWDSFQSWAAANDLEAYWQLGRGGVSGWWFLRVKPAMHVTSD